MEDWQRANPTCIALALDHALAKPTGDWFVVGSSRALLRLRKPISKFIDGKEVTIWRSSDNAVSIGPAACPHMGADLGEGHVSSDGCLVCPWHGLKLDHSSKQWKPFRVYDDGVLTWVQFDPNALTATDEPILTKRPDSFVDAVVTKTIRCEPRDIISNRLDPWHGVHFHPYAFAHLEVVNQNDDELEINVGYRAAPKLVIDVQARFHCPDARTIVMTITGGEGEGSVVETHATPMLHANAPGGPQTRLIEAVFATSARPHFDHARQAAFAIRPFMRLFAGRLWRDDAKYAERIFALRTR